jgi:hypothetical protein
VARNEVIEISCRALKILRLCISNLTSDLLEEIPVSALTWKNL